MARNSLRVIIDDTLGARLIVESPRQRCPDTIALYWLRSRLGEGGMGMVYAVCAPMLASDDWLDPLCLAGLR
jgi:hypothetical protein